VLWNQRVQTDREVLANRPDVILKTRRTEPAYSLHSSTNRQECNTKKAEKKWKYKNLGIEIQRMWNMKCFVIPVITEARGTV
jgi:hypothetical protein